MWLKPTEYGYMTCTEIHTEVMSPLINNLDTTSSQILCTSSTMRLSSTTFSPNCVVYPLVFNQK